MALQAEQIDVAHSQHVHIRAGVGNMAGCATLDLYGLVLEYVGPLLVGVAGEANGILCSGSPHLLGPNGSVRIMAIGAKDQAFVDAVMERHLKLSFLLKVA